MEYYGFVRNKELKNDVLVARYDNLMRLKLDIEAIYKYPRERRLKDILIDVDEWRIYDENVNLVEIGIVESNAKSKDVTWYAPM